MKNFKEKNEISTTTYCNKLIRDINKLNRVTIDEINDEMIAGYNSYADVLVYRAKERGKYYIQCISKNTIDTVNRKELVGIIASFSNS